MLSFVSMEKNASIMIPASVLHTRLNNTMHKIYHLLLVLSHTNMITLPMKNSSTCHETCQNGGTYDSYGYWCMPIRIQWTAT